MIEILFNAIWLAVAVGAFVFAPRRSGKALLCVAAIVVLLFPIISVSDDLAFSSNSLEEALAIIVAFLILVVGLFVFARVEPRMLQLSPVLLSTPSDPRSPPRA